jgi:hypothetical protein
MITGLPPHIPPLVEGVRCHCGRFYAVYTGSCDVQARLAEKEAEENGVRFVDAKHEPFIQCDCGQVLDFAPECPLMVQ